MIDYIFIGNTPLDETCFQVGQHSLQMLYKEALIFKRQLERQFPNEKLQFRVKPQHHDFGVYYEVIVRFNDEDEDAQNAAFDVESNTPKNWDEIARQELDELIRQIKELT